MKCIFNVKEYILLKFTCWAALHFSQRDLKCISSVRMNNYCQQQNRQHVVQCKSNVDIKPSNSSWPHDTLAGSIPGSVNLDIFFNLQWNTSVVRSPRHWDSKLNGRVILLTFILFIFINLSTGVWKKGQNKKGGWEGGLEKPGGM